MPEHKTAKDGVDKSTLAFEYVAGTLRGPEREQMTLALQTDSELQEHVQYWEAQLMSEHLSTQDRAPAKDTWQKIESQLGMTTHTAPTHSQQPHWWDTLVGWKAAGLSFAALWMVTVSLWVGLPNTKDSVGPNSDYVAVLTDGDNKPLLTALTSTEGDTLWLKWEAELLEPDSSLQLWAQSRRDGQIRPLAVFDDKARSSLTLSEASLRLIRDSEYLLLTREEEGGSAIDEPSDVLLARGVCVRLNAAAI